MSRRGPFLGLFLFCTMCATIAATIELWPNAQAPIYQLPVRDVVQGFY
jgi:hypothetical protein